jgi:hypothetical protein
MARDSPYDIKAIKNQEITSVRGAASRFDVPFITLCDRLRGHQFRRETRANNHKLTQTEKESLTQWILDM